MSAPYDLLKARSALLRKDKTLGKIIKKVGECELQFEREENTFLALLRAIIYQQLHGKAAAAIHGRVCDLFQNKQPDPEALLRFDDKILLGAGLSRNKLIAIKDLSEKTISGFVPNAETLVNMEDEAIIKQLIEIRGIGRWTVEILLIFKMGRPDILPASDLGIQRGIMLTYELDAMPKPNTVIEYGQRWKPWRSVASWYFWRASHMEDLLPG